MTKINVYDIDVENLQKMADEQNESIAEVLSRVLDFYMEQLDLWNTSPSDDTDCVQEQEFVDREAVYYYLTNRLTNLVNERLADYGIGYISPSYYDGFTEDELNAMYEIGKETVA